MSLRATQPTRFSGPDHGGRAPPGQGRLGRIRLCTLLIFLAAWWSTPPALARSAALPQIVAVRAGFAGRFKVGC